MITCSLHDALAASPAPERSGGAPVVDVHCHIFTPAGSELIGEHYAPAAPERFAAIGTLPMQDSARAVAELDRVVGELGFKGVQVGSNVAGRDLDSPRFAPFFARAGELGAIVLIEEPPSTYLKRVYFDTMVFSPDILASLVRFAGADHVLLGTYYPFDMGEQDPVGLVGRMDGLSEDERARIRGGNALRLFGLG